MFAADHLGRPAPFPLLVSGFDAADRLRVGTVVRNAPFWDPALLARLVAMTDILTDRRLELGLGGGRRKWPFVAADRLRVGTVVRNAAFWDPALLARLVAMTDILTDRRLELGLGAGRRKRAFDAASIPWSGFGTRARRLEKTTFELLRFFASDLVALPGGDAPQPVQYSGFGGADSPLIVGGTGDHILAITARHADIIGVAGSYRIPGKPPGTFWLGTAAEADERVRFAREHERADEIEWHLLRQALVPTEPARGVRSRSNHMLPSAAEQTPGLQQSPQRAGEFERCAYDQNEIRYDHERIYQSRRLAAGKELPKPGYRQSASDKQDRNRNLFYDGMNSRLSILLVVVLVDHFRTSESTSHHARTIAAAAQ